MHLTLKPVIVIKYRIKPRLILNTSICQISPDTSPHVVLLVCPTNSLLTDQAERLQERGLEPLVIGSKASNLSGSFKHYSLVILGSISLMFFHHNSNVTWSFAGWSLQLNFLLWFKRTEERHQISIWTHTYILKWYTCISDSSKLKYSREALFHIQFFTHGISCIYQ